MDKVYLISLLHKILLFDEANFWVSYFFWAFCKELVCLFYKLLLPFLTFVNYKGPYRRIPSQTLSMFRYYETKNQRSSLSEYAFQWYYALADGRISIEKEEISLYLVYSIVSLGKMQKKQNLFGKISWIWTSSQKLE